MFIDESNVRIGNVADVVVPRMLAGRAPGALHVAGTSSLGRGGRGDERALAERPLWAGYRRLGFATHLQRYSGAEDLVDEALHAQMQREVLRHGQVNLIGRAPQTMVLVTGDGNENGGHAHSTNFPECAAAALRFGWRVEVWAWRESLSANFRALQREFPAHMRVVLLDDHVHPSDRWEWS